jgi:hypothetical protein
VHQTSSFTYVLQHIAETIKQSTILNVTAGVRACSHRAPGSSDRRRLVPVPISRRRGVATGSDHNSAVLEQPCRVLRKLNNTLCCLPTDLVAIVQDIYRRLGAPLARGGLLRLRTTPDIRIARAYGHLFPDDQFENLFHVISAVRLRGCWQVADCQDRSLATFDDIAHSSTCVQ